MARTNLRLAALQLVHQSPDHLSRGFWRRLFPVDLSRRRNRKSPPTSAASSGSSLTLFLFGLGIFLPVLRIVPYLMFGGTLCVALSYMLRARIEPKFDTIAGAAARHVPRLCAAARPGLDPLFHLAAIQAHAARRHRHAREDAGRHGRARQPAPAHLLERGRHGAECSPQSIFQLLEEEGWRYSADTGWKEWDIQIYGNFFWSIMLQTVTEYHGGPKCLTRVRLRYRFVTTTVIINLLILAMIIYRDLNRAGVDLRILIPYALFLLFLGPARPALETAGRGNRRRRRLPARTATDHEKARRAGCDRRSRYPDARPPVAAPGGHGALLWRFCRAPRRDPSPRGAPPFRRLALRHDAGQFC